MPTLIDVPHNKETRTFRIAIDEFIENKQLKNRRPGYLRALRYQLIKFSVGLEERKVQEFTPEFIEETFIRPSKCHSTQLCLMNRLSTFFAFCERRRYVPENPIKRIERPTVDRVAPVILTPDEATRLLTTTRQRRPDMLARMVIGMFTGVRPHEISRLTWRDVNLNGRPLNGLENHGLITISSAQSKVRHRRVVPIPPNALEWLKVCPSHGDDDHVTPIVRPENAVRQCALVARVNWSHDILRHTAASYLLARHEDAGKVAMWLGNSRDILLNHYFQLVDPDACNAFWGIMP
jgi:integrase/recombinase XerD